MSVFDDRLLITREVAAILRVHPTTVYRMFKKGQLPSIKVGSSYRMSEIRLEQLMREVGKVIPHGRRRKSTP